MPMQHLSAEALHQVAAYFQALAEPTRLHILNELRSGPRSVGELAEATGSSNANISRHLALLAQRGLLARESQGTSVYYRIADASIFQLCELVCGSIAKRLDGVISQREAFAPPRAARARGRTAAAGR